MARQILVVEDEALIADAIAARLRSEGHEVRVAGESVATGEGGSKKAAEQAAARQARAGDRGGNSV